METNIRKLRKKKKITQLELAKRTGLSKSHINRIENGKLSGSIYTLIKISKELDCNVEDIFLDIKLTHRKLKEEENEQTIGS